MHEAAFANAALPRRTIVLKLPLRPYSLGHELRLLQRNNPLISGVSLPENKTEAERILKDAVIEAVLICAHSHQELQAMDGDWLLWLKMRIWRRRIRKEDFTAAAGQFLRYVQEGSSEPKLLEARRGPDHRPQRSLGAPFILRVLQFLMFNAHKSEAEALDYPAGLAKWHYYAFWENEDAVRIENQDERDSTNEIAAVEALVKAGVSFEEAFKRVRAEKEQVGGA